MLLTILIRKNCQFLGSRMGNSISSGCVLFKSFGSSFLSVVCIVVSSPLESTAVTSTFGFAFSSVYTVTFRMVTCSIPGFTLSDGQ